MPTQRVAILGGGISGLSCAWFMARRFPHLDITLIHEGTRVGGWMQSERRGGASRASASQSTGDTGTGTGTTTASPSYLFEAGARSLSPKASNVWPMLELVSLWPWLRVV